ncbi:MAG TPA: MFS transporter [Prolixibacteraceae bacterium]|nr:MFS transporter [Prolixibacteraceae bacterium]
MDKTLHTYKAKLSLMMFFQYMMFAVWWVPLAAYLSNIGINGLQKSLVLSSMAIGCMASPMLGMIADRYFDGQKVLAVLNALNAGFLLLAGLTNNPNWLFVFLLLAMLCYMPTWGLTSSIAMSHSQPDQFSRIRVFGAVGWVVSGVFSLMVVKLFNIGFDGTNIPFFFASAIGFLAVVFNVFLPATPPSGKGQKTSLIDAFGLRTIRLMKDRNFAVFITLSFLSMIPFSMYWSYCSEFLLDRKFEYISITMNIGQLAEMIFLLTVPFFIRKFGLRNTMIFGLFALLIRYAAFYTGSVTDSLLFYLIGILLHGLIFGYFYLGGQIYIDQQAPSELKAQSQGFIFFVTFGLGLLVGNFISGQIIEYNTSTINDIRTYNWDSIWGITSVMAAALLLSFVLFFKNEKIAVSQIVDPNLKNEEWRTTEDAKDNRA